MNFRLVDLISLLILIALPLGLSVGCNSSGTIGNDDDDEITPPDDDDDDDDDDDNGDDDDDDDATSDPSLSFDLTDAGAGSLLWVTATWEDFELSQQTGICCTTEGLVTLSAGEVSGNSVPILTFFGLFLDGEAEWGLDNGSQQVVSSFNVSPLDLSTIVAIDPGIAASTGLIKAAGEFDVYKVTTTEPNTIVTARAEAIVDEAFKPFFLVTAEDGYSIAAMYGWNNEQTQQDPFVSFVAEEAGTYFIRVQDNAQAGSATYGYDLDLGFTAITDSQVVADLEPNDETYQDLGALSPGGIQVTGTAETAGHDAENWLNGDQDFFTFELLEASIVQFSLEWATDDDFDAVLYDFSTGSIEPGWDSPDAISTDMASTEVPETATVTLEPGTYALQIGNWEGDPGATYAMNIWVLPTSVR